MCPVRQNSKLITQRRKEKVAFPLRIGFLMNNYNTVTPLFTCVFTNKPLLVTRRVPYCGNGVATWLSLEYYFRTEGSMWDEIEPLRGEIEYQREYWNEHPSWGEYGPDGGPGEWAPERGGWGGGQGGVGAGVEKWGARMGAGVGARMWVGAGALPGIPSLLSGIPFPHLVFHLPYLVSYPYLVPTPLGGILSPIWYPIPLCGTPSPIWYPIPDYITLTSHQSGILQSLIFFLFKGLPKLSFVTYVISKHWKLRLYNTWS